MIRCSHTPAPPLGSGPESCSAAELVEAFAATEVQPGLLAVVAFEGPSSRMPLSGLPGATGDVVFDVVRGKHSPLPSREWHDEHIFGLRLTRDSHG